METWLPIFVGVITLAVLLQMAILLAMFLEFRRLSERTTRIASELQSRINPILNRLQVLIEDTQPRLTGMRVNFVESLEGSGFTFENPNAAAKCGCGKSFG